MAGKRSKDWPIRISGRSRADTLARPEFGKGFPGPAGCLGSPSSSPTRAQSFSISLSITFLPRLPMAELSTIYDYMRSYAPLLGERILQEYPALQQFEDPVSPRLERLLRRPKPAQNVAIMGVVKRWQRARTAMFVAECGTGKTLMSLAAVDVHSAGKPYTALAMVPPHLVEK